MNRDDAVAAALGFAGAGAVMLAAGVTLNTLLAAVFFAAVMALLMAVHGRKRPPFFLAAGVGVAMLAFFISREFTFVQWGAAVSIVFAIVAVELALVDGLILLGVPGPLATAGVLLAAVAWATWPVWGSLHLTDAGAPRVVAIHPLFALNGLAQNLGIWTEEPMPYRLTVFGQDVVYALPTTSIYCIAAHALPAGVIALVIVAIRRRASRPFGQTIR